MRRRLTRLLLLLLALLGAAYLLFAFFLPLPGGPVGGTGRGVGAAAVGTGARVTVRAFVLRNHSTRRVRLTSVDLRGAKGVTLLGTSVQVGGIRAPVTRGFPPDVRLGRLADVDGFRMPPARGGRPGVARVVLGLRAARSGRVGLAGIDVRYSDRSLKRSVSIDGPVMLTAR